MKRTIGYICFFIAVGMLIMILTHNRLIGLIMVVLLLCIGYNFIFDD